MMNGLPDGSFSLKINLGWRASRVDTSRVVHVEIQDDGFVLRDGVYAATDWTAHC